MTPDGLGEASPEVLADDLMVERLRAGLPVAGNAPAREADRDDDADRDRDREADADRDPAMSLLAGLLLDVTSDRPLASAGPLADVVPIGRRRRGVRAAAVAACAVGLVSVGGVAAASPGTPLYGVRSAVGHAVTSVVRVVDPSAGRHRPSARPVPAATPEARSAQSARLVAALLDRAEADLALARTTPARALLRDAALHLPEVAPADGHASLAARLALLTARLPVVPATGPRVPQVRPTPVPVDGKAPPHGNRPPGAGDPPTRGSKGSSDAQAPHAHDRAATPGSSAKAGRG